MSLISAAVAEHAHRHVDPSVIAKLELGVVILAGIILIDVAWEIFRGKR